MWSSLRLSGLCGKSRSQPKDSVPAPNSRGPPRRESASKLSTIGHRIKGPRVAGQLERSGALMQVTRANTGVGPLAYVKRHHVALLALFFALGGTSFAAANTVLPSNSVGTKQVINGSLQTIDLSRTARGALKGNQGPRGLAGPQGAQGTTGATGAQGLQGPAGQAATKLFVAMDAGGTLTKNSGAT